MTLEVYTMAAFYLNSDKPKEHTRKISVQTYSLQDCKVKVIMKIEEDKLERQYEIKIGHDELYCLYEGLLALIENYELDSVRTFHCKECYGGLADELKQELLK